MDIHIQADKKLIDIQNEFQARFPFLKIEFYKHTHKPGEITKKDDLINLQHTIGEFNIENQDFDLHINESMVVKSLEMMFQSKLKIGLNVFRKSGASWLQTTTTDSWTLAEQNARGKEMSEELPKEEPEDYHEHE